MKKICLFTIFAVGTFITSNAMATKVVKFKYQQGGGWYTTTSFVGLDYGSCKSALPSGVVASRCKRIRVNGTIRPTALDGMKAYIRQDDYSYFPFIDWWYWRITSSSEYWSTYVDKEQHYQSGGPGEYIYFGEETRGIENDNYVGGQYLMRVKYKLSPGGNYWARVFESWLDVE